MLTKRSRIIIIGSGTSWLANTPGNSIITEHPFKIAAVIENFKKFFEVVRLIRQIREDRV
jgi:hypothetical protein